MAYSELAQKYRVPAGFAVAALFLFLSEPSPLLMAAGSAVMLAGLALRFWAAGHLQKARRLATGGPYGYTRNPLYLGSFLLAIGFIIAGGSWVGAAVVLAFFAAVYLPTMRREEAELRNGFREEFDRYAAQVPLFFPRLAPFRRVEGRFDLAQALRNREYNSALGCALGLMLVYLKFHLMP